MLMNYLRPDAFDTRVDHLFDEALRSVGESRPDRQLSWNMYEKEGCVGIDVAVPGLTGEDVDLTLADGIMTISVTPR